MDKARDIAHDNAVIATIYLAKIAEFFAGHGTPLVRNRGRAGRAVVRCAR